MRTKLFWGLFVVAANLAVMNCPASAQTRQAVVFPDKQSFLRALAESPVSNRVDTGFTIIDAHVNRGLGAEFNQITSLTAIFCNRDTATAAMEKAISELLSANTYKTFKGWDPNFGVLKAELQSHALMFKNPPQFEHVTIKVTIGQAKFDNRALIVDYEIQASPLANNNSWIDVSSRPEAKTYIDELCGQIRAKVEEALRAHCEKATVRDVTTEDEALAEIGHRLHMTPIQLEAVREALRETK